MKEAVTVACDMVDPTGEIDADPQDPILQLAEIGNELADDFRQ
jgi:hypothetical protein